MIVGLSLSTTAVSGIASNDNKILQAISFAASFLQ